MAGKLKNTVSLIFKVLAVMVLIYTVEMVTAFVVTISAARAVRKLPAGE